MKKLILIVLSIFAFSVDAATILPMPPELKGKTIIMIIPYNPGGDTDATQRVIAQLVTKLTGLNIVIINKAGNGGIIGTNEASKAAPNGLTILGTDNSYIINSAADIENAPSTADFIPVSIHALTPQYLYSNKFKNLPDLVVKAKTKTPIVVGCNVHHQCMYMQQFISSLNGESYIINYKTPAQAAIDASRGDIDIFGAGATSGLPFVQSNKITPIATTWTHNLSVYPDAAPMSTVVPNFKAYNMQMVLAPAETPQHIINYYNQIFRAAVNSPEFKARAKELSIITMDLTPEESQQFVKKELVQARKNKKFIR
jgi:tripartite-type tricarboxylate transporter receptor subunit TctC